MSNEASVIVETVNSITDAILADEKFMSNIAKLLRRMYSELLKEGFTPAEAMQIVSNFPMKSK